MKQEDTIPHLITFEKLFNVKNRNSETISKQEDITIEEKEEENEKVDIITKEKTNGNVIELDGIVSRISQSFSKADGKIAKYIYVSQEDIYNGKKKNYSLAVSLEDDILELYGDEIKVGDKVRVVGKLITYTNKNEQQQSIINSFDFEVLERANKNIRSIEVER